MFEGVFQSPKVERGVRAGPSSFYRLHKTPIKSQRITFSVSFSLGQCRTPTEARVNFLIVGPFRYESPIRVPPVVLSHSLSLFSLLSLYFASCPPPPPPPPLGSHPSTLDRCLKLRSSWYMGVMESRRGPVLDRILAQYLQGYHPNPPKPPPPPAAWVCWGGISGGTEPKSGPGPALSDFP